VTVSPSPLLVRLADPATLTAAWEDVRRADGGRNSPAIRRFAVGIATHLPNLGDRIRGGSWTPGSAQRVSIPKPRGGSRVLHIPAVRDRVVERAPTTVLQDELDHRLGPWSFAFRPGLGVADAVQRIVELRGEGATHLVRVDVRDFFPSIDTRTLLDALDPLLPDDVLTLIASLVTRAARAADGRDLGPVPGLAQGSPLSPLLSNVYLSELDATLHARGLPSVRYCDDIAIPVVGAASARLATAVVEESVAAACLELREPPAVVELADGTTFLGEDIDHEHPAELAAPSLDDGEPRVLYVESQGAFVNLQAGRLKVTHRQRTLVDVPVSMVARLVLFGSVSLSGYLRNYLLYHDIPVVFLSRRGSVMGFLSTGSATSATLRRRQYNWRATGSDASSLRRPSSRASSGTSAVYSSATSTIAAASCHRSSSTNSSPPGTTSPPPPISVSCAASKVAAPPGTSRRWRSCSPTERSPIQERVDPPTTL
jgi:CRISPR-associated protein Cas1